MIKVLAGLSIGVLVVSIILNATFPSEVAWMPEGFASPIVAFEFLQTTEEIKSLFGPPSAERNQWVEAMVLGHRIDYLYLLIYGLFLGVWGVYCVRKSGNKFFYLVTLLATIAAISDVVENWQLVAIAENLAQADFTNELRLLYVFTWLKWGSLAIALSGVAYYFRSDGWLGKIFIGISVLTLLLGIGAFLDRSVLTTCFSLGIVLQFGLLMVFSWMKYFNKLPDKSISSQTK